MSVANLLEEHFEAQGRRSIQIPEIERDGKPLELFFSPLTVGDRIKVRDMKAKDDLEFEILLIIVKCRLEDGSQAFTVADKTTLLRKVDWNIIHRIADAVTDVTLGQVEKNSEAIPDDN